MSAFLRSIAIFTLIAVSFQAISGEDDSCRDLFRKDDFNDFLNNLSQLKDKYFYFTIRGRQGIVKAKITGDRGTTSAGSHFFIENLQNNAERIYVDKFLFQGAFPMDQRDVESILNGSENEYILYPIRKDVLFLKSGEFENQELRIVASRGKTYFGTYLAPVKHGGTDDGLGELAGLSIHVTRGTDNAGETIILRLKDIIIVELVE